MHRSGHDAIIDANDQVIVRLQEAVPKAVPTGFARYFCEMPEELKPVDVVPIQSPRRPHTMV